MSEFEKVLDESLARLRATGSVEAALALYPQHAEALRPLLLAAAAVQNTPRPLARPSAVLAGRQRIQEAFAASQREEKSARYGIFSLASVWVGGRSYFQELLRMSTTLRPAVTFLFALIFGGFILVAAAGNSLPGEPFYPVKRLWESARLALMADPDTRLLFEEQLRAERVVELRALIDSGRETVFTFEGRLEAIGRETITVDGFNIRVNRQTVWQDRPVVGQMIRVELHLQHTGVLTARRIQLTSAGAVITPTPTATAQATSCGNIFCETPTPSPTGPTPQISPSSTPPGCNSGTCPTETGQPTDEPTVTPSPTGPTPQITPTPMPTICNFGFCGTVTATPVPTQPGPTDTPTPCNNPGCGEPTDEPTPPPDDTATPLPFFTETPPSTPECPPIGCNEPTETPTPAGCNNGICPTPTGQPTDEPTPPPPPTASPTPPPTPSMTPAGVTPTPTPCNNPICSPATETPGPTPSSPACNQGVCPTEEPTATPVP